MYWEVVVGDQKLPFTVLVENHELSHIFVQQFHDFYSNLLGRKVAEVVVEEGLAPCEDVVA